MIAIIAEKPSVGLDIARVVGADTRNDGYCSGNGYMVTWALGHLVSLAMPDTYGYTKTAAEDLPMLPDPFRLISRQMRTDRGMVTDIAASKQLKVIESVFNRCDSIIVATDAGREGELIFRWIYAFLECTKPFRRLWISSLTDEAIRKGLEELKDGSEYDSLYAAADSRAKADWLVGMNASRALAIVSGSSNNSIGRVQTPTLAMICSRYRENRSFVSTPYWQLHVTLNGGTSHRRFFHPATFDDRQKAEAAYRSLSPDSSATVTKVESRKTLQQPPLLYDLTALQKDCNVHLDLPAAKTLDIAQSLYEKKFISYPRTGSRYIPHDVMACVPGLLERILAMPGFATSAGILDFARLNTRSVDDSKVTDHHALITTGIAPEGLSEAEEAVYTLIAGRMLEAFSPCCEKELILMECRLDNMDFRSKSSLVVSPGWRGIFRRKDGEEGFRHFFTVKPVNAIEDLKGMKLRVSNDPIMTGMVSGLGANATVVSFNELYSALQTGVVDGAEQPIANYQSNAFPEVAPNLILDGHTLGAIQVIITDEAWDKLTPEQQDVLTEAGKYASEYNRKISEEAENKVLDELKANGVSVVDVEDKTPWQEACKDIIESSTKDNAELYQKILDMAK